jgi:cytochrome P450
VPLLGSALDLQRRGQVAFFVENWRAYGDVVRFRLGPFVAHILAHPDHIHHVLVRNASNYPKGPSYAKMRPALGSGLATSEGALWRRQRRLIQPSFTHGSVLGLGNQIAEALDSALSEWHRTVSARRVIAINREMAHLSLTILLRTIFGSDAGANARPILEATMEVGSFLNRRLASFVDIPLVVPTPANRRFTNALQGFDSSIAELVQARRSQRDGSTDLLGALLSARDSETGVEMSDRQVRDEVFTILLAGHETVALGLTWAWYLLAHHPHVEHRLQAELAARLSGRPPAVEDLPALPYTRMVLEEAMRLYPPIWAVPRAALADDEIAGYHIPAGSLIFASQFLAHRHLDFWESPATFDPERFAPDRAEQARRAYFPFGEGARSCMGAHFAMVEMCLVLATVAQRYRLRLLPGPPIEPTSMVSLHPSRDVLGTVEDR